MTRNHSQLTFEHLDSSQRRSGFSAFVDFILVVDDDIVWSKYVILKD
jgi:hypothetical protein